jgi:hypothetical protein
MGEKIAPTAAEAKWIAELKAVARKRPHHLWLFSASGSLNVMRGGPDAEHIHLEAPHGGVDPAYSLDTISIPNDGGDW